MSYDDPVLLLATTDQMSRDVIGSELRRRYGGDYEVVVCADYAHARAVLEGLKRWGRQVALVVACFGPHDREGLDFLRRAYSLHPSAKRAICAIWGDFASTPDVFAAIGQGHAELVLLRPERRRDEEFHGSIVDALDDWHLAQGIGFEAVRIIGEQRDERTHSLRDSFGRNHIPVGFHQVGTESATRLLAGLGLTDPELPVVQLAFTSPPTTLEAPTDLEIADAFGLMAPLTPDRVYDVVVVGAGPERTGGGRLRVLRGAVHARGRAAGGRRAGRHVVADPQLSGVLARGQWRPPGLPVLPAGVGLRHRVQLHEARRVPRAPRATCVRSRWRTAARCAAAAS